LDDNIKEHILNNRFYHRPKEEKPVPIHTQINNYNQINNIVQQIDTIEKIKHCNDFTKKEMIDFEDHIEDMYISKANKLDKDKFKGFQLTWTNLRQMIDETLLNCGKNVETFNFVYNDKADKIAIYHGGEWKPMFFDVGVSFMLSAVQSFYLNSYECYVIRNIENNTEINCHTRAEFRDRLKDYYKFLVCFDFYPFSKGEYDFDSLIDGDIAPKYFNMYLKVKEDTTTRECQKVREEIYTIIKRNSKINIQDFNKTIMNMLQVNPEFLTMFLNKFLPQINPPP
jgi:hypothetical protein